MSVNQYARAALAVVAVTAVLAPAVVGPADASSPPRKLCPVCGDQLEREASYGAGASVTTTGSDLRMAVDERGDADVRARVSLNASTAERFRENESLQAAVVDAAFDDEDGSRYAVGVDRARNVTARMDGDVLVVTYEVPSVAREGRGGVLLVTAFGAESRYVETNVDRFAMVGPDGTAVANDPRTGAVESREATRGVDGSGEAVVWEPVEGKYRDGDGRLDRGTYVAFAPDDGLGARLDAELAVASTVGPAMLDDAVTLGGPAALVLALALLACLFVVGESASPEREARLLLVLGAGIAVVGAGYQLLDGRPLQFGTNLPLLVVPAGVAALAALSMRSPAVASLREAVLRVGGTVGVAGIVAAALLSSFLVAFAVLTAAVVGGFYVVGVLDERVGWPVAAVGVLVVVAPVLGVLPATPAEGLGAGVLLTFLTGLTVLLVPVGVLAYRLGASARVTSERVVEARTTA